MRYPTVSQEFLTGTLKCWSVQRIVSEPCLTGCALYRGTWLLQFREHVAGHSFVIDPFFGGVRTGGGLYRYRRKNLVEKARGREVVLVQCGAHTHTYKKTGAC